MRVLNSQLEYDTTSSPMKAAFSGTKDQELIRYGKAEPSGKKQEKK